MVSKVYSCLLGGAFGEFLGSQVENLKKDDIEKLFPLNIGIFPTNRCCLTDDWEMTKGLANGIIKYKRIETYEIHNSYLLHFHPEKGYSRKTRGIFTHAKTNGFTMGPGNSICDGCIMRISPLAISGARDPEKLRDQVISCLYFTHNTTESLVCSFLYCGLLQYLLYDDKFDEKHIKSIMLNVADKYCNELYIKLQLTFSKLEHGIATSIEELLLGKNNHMQIKAIDCLCCAIYYFLKYKNASYVAVQKSIYGGGDTDTVGKIVGELCGAYVKNVSWIPSEIIVKLNNQERIIDIANNLEKIRCE